MATDVQGSVYIIHLHHPLAHARHYVGWASDVEARVARHRSGNGSKLMAAVGQAGIPWEVARIINGATRADERRIHNSHATAAFCPVCAAERGMKLREL